MECSMSLCVKCRSSIAQGRAELGHDTCLPCGEINARKVKHTIVPMHKSNYVPIFDLQDLKGINNNFFSDNSSPILNWFTPTIIFGCSFFAS